jgi:hypothetical protein
LCARRRAIPWNWNVWACNYCTMIWIPFFFKGGLLSLSMFLLIKIACQLPRFLLALVTRNQQIRRVDLPLDCKSATKR